MTAAQKNGLKSEAAPSKWIEYGHRVIFILLFLLVPHDLIPHWEIIKYGLLCLTIVVELVVRVKKGLLISIDKIDLLILGFASLQFTSFFWASFKSLIWIQASHSLLLAVIFILTRRINYQNYNIKAWTYTFIGALLFNYGFIAIEFFTLPDLPNYQGISRKFNATFNALGYFPNYISSLFVLSLTFFFIIKRKHNLPTYLLIILFLIQSILILITNSKGSIIALYVIVFITIYYTLPRVNLGRKWRALFWAIGVTLPLFLFLKVAPKISKQYDILLSIQHKSNDDRLQLWRKSVQLIKEKPILGFGANNWQIVHQKYGYGDINYYNNGKRYYSDPHNYFLKISSETGIISLFLILYLYFLGIRKRLIALRQDKDKTTNMVLLCMLLTSFILAFVYTLVFVTHLKVGTIEIILYIILCISLQKESQSKSSLGYTLFLSLMFITSVVFRTYFISKEIKTSSFLSDITQIDKLLAIEKFNEIYDASHYQYFKAQSIKRIEANYLLQKRDNKAALATILEAIESNPYLPDNHAIQGILYQRKGLYADAKKSYYNSIRLNPNSIKPYVYLGHLSLISKNKIDFQKAISIYENRLEPILENDYDEQFWDDNIPKRTANWTTLCSQIDQMQYIISRGHTLGLSD